MKELDSAQRFDELLHDLRACSEARDWARNKDLHEVWVTCERVDWLLWLAGRMAGAPGWPTRNQIILAACACAETALKFVPEGELRPRLAIEAARAFVRGDANIEDVRVARRAAAAYAAAAYAAAADAAYAAADAADAYAAADAADAAAAAAADAADAAAAVAAAAYAAAADRGKKEETPPAQPRAEMLAIVRRELPEPQWQRAVSQ